MAAGNCARWLREEGDEVLLVLDTGLEDKITAVFEPPGGESRAA